MKLTNKGKCVDIIRWNLQGLELVSVQHFRGQGNEEKPAMKLRMNIQEEIQGGMKIEMWENSSRKEKLCQIW